MFNLLNHYLMKKIITQKVVQMYCLPAERE